MTRPLVSPTPPRPAPLERLGWLLFPGHFLLGLLILQPYFAPVDMGRPRVFGGADQQSPVAWVITAALTALLAIRPVTVGARRVGRGSLPRVVVGMVGFGYVNLLLCAVLRALAEGEEPVGMLFYAAIFGLPSAMLCTVPFVLLDVPPLLTALQLDDPPTFEDEDRLVRLAGLHALGMASVAPLAAWGLGMELLDTTLGALSAWAVGAGGLFVVVYTSCRMRLRAAFVERVRRGGVARFEVGPLGDAATPAPLLRTPGSSEALFYLNDTPAAGAYRTGTLRVPVALV